MSITAYVKPTNRCNVGCTHCYLPHSVRADKSVMCEEVLAQTARFIADMKLRARHQSAHILWHGGEPLVLSSDWFFKAGETLDELLPGHTESMQTSLIPLRKEHLDLITTRFGSFVGSSVDFSQRMIKGSVEEYHRIWMKKVDMARAAGIEVIPGVVPTTLEIGRERDIVNWFVERNFVAFNIDRYNAYGTYFSDRPTNLQHSRFLIGLFDALMEQLSRTGSAPLVGAIRASITGVLFGIAGDRWGGTCMSDFIVVEPDGFLNNCPDKSSFEENHGNVSDGFDAFAKNRFRKKWIKHQALTHKESYCDTCENQHFCQSGCPITPNGPSHGEDECSGYHSYLAHVRKFALIPENKALVLAYINQTQRAEALEKASVYINEPSGACAA